MARANKASRWRRRIADAALLFLLLPALGLCDTGLAAEAAPAVIGADEASLAGTAGRDVYLEVTVNGAPRGLVHFGDRGGALWASRDSLRQLGFLLPAGTSEAVELNRLGGLQVDYDAMHQRVTLTATLDLLELPETTLGAQALAAGPITNAPGLLLNYDLQGTGGNGSGLALSAFTELRAFGRWGVLSHSSLAQQQRDQGSAEHQSVRLDTSWSQSWPERLLTLRVGDTLTGSLAWSRATHIGGIQLGSNFALQPYRVTTPVPALLGSATLPSRLDLYVNGMRQFHGEVPAGPFRLDALPSITGAGVAQVVLTDAFGRATTLDFSLYGTQQLLAKGLTSWSVELGHVREDYGLRSNHYGRDPMASGSWRRGLSDAFTLEAHGEAGKGLLNAGLGAVGLLGDAGVLTGALAHSNGSGQHGSQLALGYSWNDRRFNVALSGQRAQSGYRDVAALYGSPPARTSASATLGYNSPTAGGFSLSYLHLDYPGQDRSRYLSAGWLKSLGRTATFSLTLVRDLGGRKDYSAYATLTWSLGDRSLASVGLEHDRRRSHLSASASQATPSEGGWGWNVRARTGTGARDAQGEVNYLGPWGRYTAGASTSRGSRYLYGGASGALVFMEGRPFAARRISDAFALVSTQGVADVPVLLENRRIGRTDGAGHLLVTPLNAYQNNRIGIDPMALPASLRIPRVDADVTPSDRAGALVRFEIEPVRAALVLLVDPSGAPLPLASRVQLEGQAGSALVGHDGAVYLDTLGLHNRLSVQTLSGRCSARFDYHEEAGGAIPQLGPLTCHPEPRP